MKKMKKLRFVGVLILISMIVFAGCSSSTEDKSEEPSSNSVNKNSEEKKSYTINFSTVAAPGAPELESLYTFEEELEQLSEGQIDVVIHHSGSLYPQGNDERAMMKGNLEMTYVSPAIVAEHLPEASMFTAGYFFKDNEDMDAVLNGEIGKSLYDKVAKKTGYRVLGALYQGVRHLNYRDVGGEVKSPEDITGLLLRMPDQPAMIFMGEAMGASVTPLAFSELYTALSTGTVDAQDNPLTVVISNKFYEVTDYISLTGHMVANLWPAINEELWNELGPELQKAVNQAMMKAKEVNDQMVLKGEKEAIEFLESKGMTIVQPDREAFRNQVQEAYLNSEISSEWDMDLYNKIQNRK